MVFKSAKKKLSRDEIVEILKRNADLYRSEPDFINYIVDLTIFMIEHQFEGNAPTKTAAQSGEILTTYSPLEMYRIYRQTDTTTGHYCRMCGEKLGSEQKCMVCGHMI